MGAVRKRIGALPVYSICQGELQSVRTCNNFPEGEVILGNPIMTCANFSHYLLRGGPPFPGVVAVLKNRALNASIPGHQMPAAFSLTFAPLLCTTHKQILRAPRSDCVLQCSGNSRLSHRDPPCPQPNTHSAGVGVNGVDRRQKRGWRGMDLLFIILQIKP